MRAFADLLDSLIYTRSRNAKLKLIGDYLRATPDPDRGLALAAMTGGLVFPNAKAGLVRALIAERKKPFDQMPSEQDGGVLTKNIVLDSK